MAQCKSCGRDLPAGAIFCPYCGKRQEARRGRRKRGNGQGTISTTPSGKYMATVTLGYYTDENGKRHRQSRSKVFDTKREAAAAIPQLLAGPAKQDKQTVTFKDLYDRWLPTHRAGKSTIDCYRAAIRYFEPIWYERIADIDVDDLQECLDDCPRGKRTRENMRAVCGLIYKYGIPRKMIPDNLNLAPFLVVDGDPAKHRSSFTDVEILKIKNACGIVPYADMVYCMIYSGFRPSEFLALTKQDYDPDLRTLTGGAKTDAGKNRTVTVSPKILPYISARAAGRGPLFPDPAGRAWELKSFTETAFYPALESIGIENPIVDVGGGVKRHRITPHSCRRTFATLMKRVDGADKDKLELIGHSSTEMLRYYQNVALEDLRRITDAI